MRPGIHISFDPLTMDLDLFDHGILLTLGGVVET